MPPERNLALHTESYGEGPAVLLAHGFGGSARNFRPQARALRDRYRVLLFDARGHARSPAPLEPGSYRAEQFVDDMAWVLDEAGVDQAVVGGLSMGAAMALDFALHYPKRVRGLVLASFPPGSRKGVAAHALAFAEMLETEGLDAAGAEFVWGTRSGLAHEAAALVRRGFLEHSPLGLAGCLREYLARQPAIDTLRQSLASLSVPALLIAGSEDIPSVRATQELARALPGSRLHILEGIGHVVNLEATALFNAVLLEFLESV